MPLGLSTIVVRTGYGKDTSDAVGMARIANLPPCATSPLVFWCRFVNDVLHIGERKRICLVSHQL